MTTWLEVSNKLAAMSPDFQIMGSRTPPTEAEIDEVAERLGVTFPFQYRELVGRFAAFAVEAKASKWPAPKLYDVAPAWTFVRGFAVYAFGDEVPDFLSLEKATRAFREENGGALVPFFRLSGSADVTCFKRDGQLVVWRHDDESRAEPAPAADVYGLLFHHLEALEENMAEMKKLRAAAGAKKDTPPKAATKPMAPPAKPAKPPPKKAATPPAKPARAKPATPANAAKSTTTKAKAPRAQKLRQVAKSKTKTTKTRH
jgi:hypothetical protein